MAMANQKEANSVEIHDESEEKLASPSDSKKAKKVKEDIPGLVLNDNGEEEYKVEKIITKKLVDGVIHYRIKWVGWDSKYNTWEPIENLENCLEMVREFDAAYQTDGNGASKKGRGRPIKLRPPVKPGHDKFFSTEEEPANVELEPAEVTDEDKAVNEYLDQRFMGPMFRRVWKESEIPLLVLGSSIINGALVHLVRIQVNDETSVVGDPYDGLTENNCVMVLAQTFNCHFPQMVLEYFENNSKFVKGTAASESMAAKAARIEILRLCRSQGVYANEEKLFRDILETTQSTGTGDSDGLYSEKVVPKMTGLFSHFGSTLKKSESTSEIDKFGLPPDTSSSDSEDSTEEIIKDFKQDRIKKSASKRKIESDEEEEGSRVEDTANPKVDNTKNPKVDDTDNLKVDDAHNPNVEDTDNRKMAKEQENDVAMVQLTVEEEDDSDLETVVDEHYALNAEIVRKFKSPLDNADEIELLDWGDLDSDTLEID